MGKWARVLAESRAAGKIIEPFEVTADLVLLPPTPARAKAMSAATQSVQAAIQASLMAVKAGAEEAELAAIRERIEAADLAYTKALIGEEHFDEVESFFADQGSDVRELFFDTIKTQFLRLPDDGVCQHCGQVIDADQAGNVDGSSTISSTTGTSSKPTSESDSTESEPETGATNGSDCPGLNS